MRRAINHMKAVAGYSHLWMTLVQVILIPVALWAQKIPASPQHYNGNFYLATDPPVYFCRPSGSSIEVSGYVITASELDLASERSDNQNYDGPSVNYYVTTASGATIAHSRYLFRGAPYRRLDSTSKNCGHLNNWEYTNFYGVCESSEFYAFHLKPFAQSGAGQWMFDVDTIRYEMRLGDSGDWTLISSTNTNNSFTSQGKTVQAHIRGMGDWCGDLSGFNLLKFKPQYYPDLAVDGYTPYQVRAIIGFDCSAVSDTVTYQYKVYERIKDVPLQISGPCGEGILNNGSVTVDFANRTGGRYIVKGTSSTELSRSDFRIRLLKDGFTNEVYDGCPVDSVSSTSGNTFSGLTAGDYLVEITCINEDYLYGYTYYDTITIRPWTSDLGLEEKYIICEREGSVTLTLPDHMESYQWDAICYAYTGTGRAATFSEGTLVVATVETPNGCFLRDTTTIADLSGFDYHLNIFDGVINASAAEFSSNWPVSYLQMSWNSSAALAGFVSKPAYQRGSAGVYRPNNSYDYLTVRAQEKDIEGVPLVNLRQDGVMNQLRFFDWANGADDHCLPDWVLNNTITAYNATGFELENKDIMDICSAALYGYRNQLPIAVSANAKLGEIGFESFEEYPAGATGLNQLNNASGNIDLVPGSVNALSQRFHRIPVLIGQGKYALIRQAAITATSLCQDGWVDVDLYVMIPDPATGKLSDFTLSTRAKMIGSNCEEDKVVVELDKDIPGVFNPNECHHWRGEIIVYEDVAMNGYINLNLLRIASDTAHTGKRSLFINSIDHAPTSGPGGPLRDPDGNIIATPKIWSRQHKLNLEYGKTYQVSAWIHHSQNQQYSTSALEVFNKDNKVGVHIKTGEITYFFQPSGKVVNGWQQVNGTFIHQSREPYADIFFESAVPFYLDDIRIFPEDGNIQTYVYDPQDYRLRATLDPNNYATIYLYDAEGKLFAVKKETVEGILTIQQSNSYMKGN